MRRRRDCRLWVHRARRGRARRRARGVVTRADGPGRRVTDPYRLLVVRLNVAGSIGWASLPESGGEADGAAGRDRYTLYPSGNVGVGGFAGAGEDVAYQRDAQPIDPYIRFTGYPACRFTILPAFWLRLLRVGRTSQTAG